MTFGGILEGLLGHAVWSRLSSWARTVSGRKIEITAPRSGEILSDPEPLGSGFSYEVRGHLKSLPDGHQIWLLTADERFEQYRPQGFYPVQYDEKTGEWKGRINGSGTSPLRIFAVVAPPTSQDFFRYFQRCGDETKRYSPLNRIPPECRNRHSVQARLISQLAAGHGSSVSGRIPNSEALTPILTILDKEPVRQPTAVYKSKLYIVLRNDSGKDFDMLAATWEPGDIGLPLPKQLWQLEGSGGWQTRSWQPKEYGEVQNVRPTQVLSTWVPLVPAIQDPEVRRNIVQKRVGTLVIHLKVAGHNLEAQRVRL